MKTILISFSWNCNLKLEKRAKTYKQNIDKYGLKSWHGLAFSIPIIIIAFLMMVGTILSWSRSTIEWFITILTWILLPFLILVVFFFCDWLLCRKHIICHELRCVSL